MVGNKNFSMGSVSISLCSFGFDFDLIFIYILEFYPLVALVLAFSRLVVVCSNCFCFVDILQFISKIVRKLSFWKSQAKKSRQFVCYGSNYVGIDGV